METPSTPLEIHLTGDAYNSFKDQKKLMELSDEMEKLSFTKAGCYSIKEMEGVRIAAFVNTERKYYGVIYEHPAVGFFADIAANYQDETTITASNAPTGGQLDHMPGSIKIYKKSAPISELFNEVDSHIGEKPLADVSAESFKPDFEKAYSREMEWRAMRGGATEAEIRRVAEDMDENFDDDTVDMAKSAIKAGASFQLLQVCRNRFINENIITEGRWKARENLLVIIHENMNSDDALEELYALDGFELEDEQDETRIREIIGNEPSKIAGFEKAIASITDKIRFSKLGEISKPMRAALYEVEEILK